MEWIADPMTAGGWLRERLDDDWSMHHFVPHGFEAYARIFHPALVRDDADAEETATTWAEAASAFGTTLHAHASWQHLVRTPTNGDWRTRIAQDGREFSAPSEGEMPPELLAAIAGHLIAHTSTPDAGFAAVWEGWGGLLGGHGGNGRGFIEFTDEVAREPMWWGSLRESFENPFRKAKWHPGILSDEISKGPRFELPDRSHVLFSAAPAVFANPDWILEAPWRDREAESHGFEPDAQHPSILWPEDRAWVMVSEIDHDSTIVAGSNELIRAICTDPAIEALPIREGSSLHWDADEINR
ncbi:hypothetical protein [Microbacterium abyssi]|uniref:hypothetical protein n=1 Tax=Microbacterium abyssi TaxID=2782166 RepID=UPI0018884A65|nr:hypothetical protein [Microbacterium sp. A18JL241]